MLPKKYITTILLALILILHPRPSVACSLEEGFLPPSNYELVRETEVIMLAEAVSYGLERGPNGLNIFTFKVLEVLKGKFGDRTLRHEGIDMYRGKGSEVDFNGARPGAYTGGCNAYDYRVGMRYLLFLNKVQGKWAVSGPPFSRINEEVSRNESPWLVAVRHYVRVARLDNYETEKAALRKLREDALRGGPNHPKGLVKDIDFHFNSPHGSKSYQDLVALYKAAISTEARSRVMWAFAHGRHEEAKLFVRDLLRSGEWENYIAPVCEFIRLTKDRSSFQVLARAYIKTENRYERSHIMRAMIELAGREDVDLMLSALKTADSDEVRVLVTWFVQHPVDEATAIIREHVKGEYKKWELTFGLAGLGDKGVLEWAKELIKSSDEDRWMGFYVIARSTLAESNELAITVIHGADEKGLISLIQGYADSVNPNRWDRLHDIIKLPRRSAEVEYWVRRTLEEMAARGDGRASELRRLMR